MASALQAAYDARIRSGAIQPDPAQAAALAPLVRLELDLSDEEPEGGILAMLRRRHYEAPHGVYLVGPVGRGKSMLMDLFYETVSAGKKRRTHFHVFMGEVHKLIDAWRKGDAKARRARFGQHKGDDPIVPVADVVARDARVLCFDEFQVTDIADAMILGRLFQALFERGVTLVATSNRLPDDLYRNGINRQLFTPFIDLLKSKVDVVTIAGPHDYRLDRLRAADAWFSPLDPDNRRQSAALWRDLMGPEQEDGETVEVLGRKLSFPHAAGGMLRAGFESLCSVPLGPNDYVAIAERFHTVFLEDVPKLTPNRREEARRFVILIDALYEAHTHLIMLAEAEPTKLYPEGDGSFEFERTASRLQEMRSTDWLQER